MKKFLFPLTLMLLGIVMFSSCLKDECSSTQQFVRYDPVVLTDDQIRAQIVTESPRPLEHPGKIYVFGKYLFINELREGVHVYDNSDPAQPQNLGFIAIPGNIDISIKSNILYADNYMDLLAIDISDIQNPEVIYRDENAFGAYYPQTNQGRIAYYEKTDVTMEIDCQDNRWGMPWFGRGGVIFFDANAETTGGGNSNTIPSTGVGGSMARFTIANSRLYTIDQSDLHVYNIVDPRSPNDVADVNIGWGIETIFPADDHLFIGANNGMYIYSAVSNPDQPTFVSRFEHAQACDPVFVQGDLAYVTLRGGTSCQNFDNQLDIIDISNYSNPRLLATHDMQHPHGLSVYQDEILICEGKYGWKSFKMHAPENIDLQNHLKDLHSYDVIRLGEKLAMIVGENGLYQYDLSDIDKPELISEIIANP